MLAWLFGAGAAGLVATLVVQYRQAARTYRPLASRRPERVAQGARPLGTEALDLDAIGRVQRRNESLERAHTNWTRSAGRIMGAEASDLEVTPWPEDETYAGRYHAAFLRNKDDRP